jgi:hypothetical protein
MFAEDQKGTTTPLVFPLTWPSFAAQDKGNRFASTPIHFIGAKQATHIL